MEARLVNRVGATRHSRHITSHADRNAAQQIGAGQAMALGRRQHGGHDDRSGMHRTALEGVVEVLAVRRGAVDEGRAFDAQRGPSAWPMTVHGPAGSIAAKAART